MLGVFVDYVYVVIDIVDLFFDLGVEVIVFDCWCMDVMKGELDWLGIQLLLVLFGQGFKDMVFVLDILEVELFNSWLVYGMYFVLQFCVVNVMIVCDLVGN